MAELKKKLLIVADTYYPKVDGTLKFIEQFIKQSHADFDISLLVPLLEKSPRKTDFANITFIEPSSWINISGYPSVQFSFKNLRRIKTAIQQADIVFIQGPALISYLSIYYGHKLNKKTIFYTHTLSWELIEQFFPPLSRLLHISAQYLSIAFFNRCTTILVPYPELRWQLQKQGVTTAIEVARLGVDINVFTPTTDKQSSKTKLGLAGKNVLGYVGRISKEKNTSILLKAFRKLNNPEQNMLLLVGDGPEDQVKMFKRSPYCKVTGFVNNVQNYLQAMDIFIMPSLTETTSLATLEAMASGLPVIASRVGFIKSYLKNKHNGLFFQRNNAGNLALKIEQLLENKELSEKLSKNARKTVAYSFSWERSINRIKRLILS